MALNRFKMAQSIRPPPQENSCSTSLGVLAQFERRLIQERTKAGLNAARARGRKGARPKVKQNNSKVQIASIKHESHLLLSLITDSASLIKKTLFF